MPRKIMVFRDVLPVMRDTHMTLALSRTPKRRTCPALRMLTASSCPRGTLLTRKWNHWECSLRSVSQYGSGRMRSARLRAPPCSSAPPASTTSMLPAAAAAGGGG